MPFGYTILEGGTTINYEIRYMLMLLEAIINQKPVQALRRYVNWERILSVSDYQNIVGLVYLGTLGIEKEISEECGQQFYQKYRKGLLLYESYKKAEEVILWQLERYGIDALLLSDSSVGELYPLPEMASLSQIEILVDKKNLPQIYRLMRDMDYEQEQDRLGSGDVYVRVPGIRVVFYGEIPIANKVLKRYFSGPVRKYLRMETCSQQDNPSGKVPWAAEFYSAKYRYIHILSDEEEYMYRVGKLVELYLTGILKIRDVLEFWLFRNVLDEAFSWKAVKELLEKAKWTQFVHQADVLSSLWFEEGVRLQYGIALELEEYILLHGQENKHLDKMLLPHEKVRLDFYRRDREEEWSLKKREWMFPPRDYMCQFFPVLDKFPFLLVFCWGIRYVRILIRMCQNKCKNAWFRFSVRLLDIKEKMKGLIKRKEKEVPEEMTQSNDTEDVSDAAGSPEEVLEQTDIDDSPKKVLGQTDADSGLEEALKQVDADSSPEESDDAGVLAGFEDSMEDFESRNNIGTEKVVQSEDFQSEDKIEL